LEYGAAIRNTPQNLLGLLIQQLAVVASQQPFRNVKNQPQTESSEPNLLSVLRVPFINLPICSAKCWR
jgi:hypothetical protein